MQKIQKKKKIKIKPKIIGAIFDLLNILDQIEKKKRTLTMVADNRKNL